MVTCWFEPGRVPVAMLIEFTLKDIHGKCAYNIVWKAIP